MLKSVVTLIGILAMTGLLAPVAHAGASASSIAMAGRKLPRPRNLASSSRRSSCPA